MKNTIKFFGSIVFVMVLAVSFGACFSPWLGEHEAALTIVLGDSTNASINNIRASVSGIPWPPDGDNNILDYLEYTITLTGNGERIELFKKSTDVFIAYVSVGRWLVQVDAFLEGVETYQTPNKDRLLYARGEYTVDVRAGQTNTANIQMNRAFDNDGHICAFSSWIVTTAATCTEAAIESRTCSCGKEETRTSAAYPALGHDYDYTSGAIPPTCTLPGSGLRFCRRDGCDFEQNLPNYSALGHNWTITTPPSLLPLPGGTLGVQTCTVCFDTNNIPYMVHVEGGSFMFGRCGDGSGSPFVNEGTPSLQTVNSFSIGRYQVTQAEWAAVMTSNINGISPTPSSFSSNPAAGEDQNRRPVERVSWYDVLVFCNLLSIEKGLIPAYRINDSSEPDDWGPVPTSNNSIWNAVEIVAGSNGYRLPTEHQWEFAAKGGRLNATYDSRIYYVFSGSNNAAEVAWHDANSLDRTREVGRLAANELGLFDMSGNVWEWCFTLFGTTNRVIRGGSCGYSADHVRSTSRLINNPFIRNNITGFRVIRP
jgi:formylglycine-generating enzyme required for sulfatase activity